MADITIYTSEGNQYDGSSQRQNEQIQDYFFDGVRFAVEKSRGTTITAFFRAREPSNRAEQYYAVFEASRRSNRPIADFAEEVPQYVENELGLEIDNSGGDTEVFEAVLNGWSGKDIPGTDFERVTLARLIKRGQRPQVGVHGPRRALALGEWLVENSSGRSFAIADNASGDALSEFDLAIEPGSHRGLQPLAGTADLFETAKKEHEEQFISSKVSNISSEIEDLRTETDLSSNNIKNRLKRDLNIFDVPSSTSYDGMGSDADDDSWLPSRRKLIAGSLVAVLLIGAVGILAYVLTTVLGVQIPIISGLLGGGSAAPSISLASVAGDSVEDPGATIEIEEPTPEFEFNVTGASTDAELVVNHSSEAADNPINRASIDDGRAIFELDTTQLSEGENALQVSVSSADVVENYTVMYAGEPEVEPSVSITSKNGSAATIQNDTVQIHTANPTLSVETAGFEGGLELSVSNGSATIQGATAQASASPIEFPINTSRLHPLMESQFLVSSVDGDASVDRTLVYRPAAVTRLTGGQNATVSGNNITVSGDGSLNIITEYSAVNVSVGADTRMISGGEGTVNITKEDVSQGDELAIEVPGSDIMETYQLKSETSS